MHGDRPSAEINDDVGMGDRCCEQSEKCQAAEYRDILLNSKLTILEVSTSIAEQAAQLRAAHNIRTPDAIQLATAMAVGASYFITNDDGVIGTLGIGI